MLSRYIHRAVINNSKNIAAPQRSALVNPMFRTVYTKETMPHVFINQHTKVLVQGMTGKHVSKSIKYSWMENVISFLKIYADSILSC